MLVHSRCTHQCSQFLGLMSQFAHRKRYRLAVQSVSAEPHALVCTCRARAARSTVVFQQILVRVRGIRFTCTRMHIRQSAFWGSAWGYAGGQPAVFHVSIPCRCCISPRSLPLRESSGGVSGRWAGPRTVVPAAVRKRSSAAIEALDLCYVML